MTHKTREEYTSFLLTARRLDYSDFRCCITPWILHRWLFSLVPRHAVFNQCGAIWPRSPTNSGQTRANERWNRAVLLTFYHLREISTLFRVIADKRGISRTKILLLFFCRFFKPVPPLFNNVPSKFPLIVPYVERFEERDKSLSFVESRKFSRKPALLRLEFFATSNCVRLFQLFRLGWCELFDFVSFICFVYLTDSRMFSSTFYLNIARQISGWNTIERIVGQIRYTKTRLEYVYSPIYSLLLVWIY